MRAMVSRPDHEGSRPWAAPTGLFAYTFLPWHRDISRSQCIRDCSLSVQAHGVVKDGQTLVERGYGYADRDSGRHVDPESTLCRIGSVSKLFTWTAVMQLVEAGRLDLDRDVNAYLDFAIPSRDGQPITLCNLMTHTPGFEEAIKNLITDDADRLRPLGESLERWTPGRIFPAGEVPAYSDYGVSLAGYIVERVSGESLDDYLDTHVFEPLRMSSTTTRQPLPARFVTDMSSGYDTASGPARPFELVTLAPAVVRNRVFLLWRTCCRRWRSRSALSGNLFAFDDDLDPWLAVLRTRTLVFTVGTGILPCWNARLAWQHRRGLASGAWAIALVFACFVMVYVSIAFNVVGFGLDY